jgi:hypothetical protein
MQTLFAVYFPLDPVQNYINDTQNQADHKNSQEEKKKDKKEGKEKQKKNKNFSARFCNTRGFNITLKPEVSFAELQRTRKRQKARKK